jgi:hypothetical protein
MRRLRPGLLAPVRLQLWPSAHPDASAGACDVDMCELGDPELWERRVWCKNGTCVSSTLQLHLAVSRPLAGKCRQEVPLSSAGNVLDLVLGKLGCDGCARLGDVNACWRAAVAVRPGADCLREAQLARLVVTASRVVTEAAGVVHGRATGCGECSVDWVATSNACAVLEALLLHVQCQVRSWACRNMQCTRRDPVKTRCRAFRWHGSCT